jgi:glycosyltransferase involved in cell wall biosynthesis
VESPSPRGRGAVIDVVLPALDEAEALPIVLGSLPTGYRPLVVDNGSTDDTAAVARGLGATVVTEPRRGFGAACYAGLIASTSRVVCFMDCDGSLTGEDLPRVVTPLLDGTADLVLGARRAAARAWPVHARLANRYLAWHVRRRTGAPLTDLGPMRAAHREALRSLHLRDRRSGWPLEMVLKAAALGWRIAEVPVAYQARTGRSKVTGTVRGTAQAVHDMAMVLR